MEPSWLSDSPVFTPGLDAFWERYAHLARPLTLAKGAVVFEVGEPADCFYYVVSGRVKIYVARPDGARRILSIAEQGNALGTSSCFDCHPRYVSAATLSKTRLLVFPRGVVLDAMANDPELIAKVLSSFARKQRSLALQAHSTVLLSTSARVALFICHLSTAYGVALEDQPGTRIMVRMSTEELASVLGISRATLSRELSSLVRDGLLCKRKWDLIVLDYGKLWERANAEHVTAFERNPRDRVLPHRDGTVLRGDPRRPGS